MNTNYIIYPFIGIFLLFLAIQSQFPAAITPDAAMHAEIVEAIGHQGFITTWEPYTSNSYTYPPLFHYIAFVLPLEPIDAVRALGIVLWLVMPIAMYFLVATYDTVQRERRKRAALVAAFLVGLVPVFSNVFIYGEFPQLMSMILILVEWYLLRREKLTAAGAMVGLIALTHVFFVLVAGALYVYYLWLHRTVKVRHVVMPALVALPWSWAYIQIVKSVLAGTWENTRYNATQPVFGFWQWQTIYDWLFSVHGLTAVLFGFAVYGLFALGVSDRKLRDESRTNRLRRDYSLQGMFVLCVLMTIFHVPFTQLKMLDLLALPAVMLAAIGLDTISAKMLKTYCQNALILFVLIFLAVVQVQHFLHVREHWFNPEIAPSDELIDAARWLKNYDDSFVRVFFYQAPAWSGVLSHKIPLDPDITHLEAFSSSYKEQLAANAAIKETLKSGNEIDLTVIDNYDIQYIIAPIEFGVTLDLLYSNGVWGVYE